LSIADWPVGSEANWQSEINNRQSWRPLEPDTASTVEGRNSRRDRSILLMERFLFYVAQRFSAGNNEK
jgi:hypothetical protein